MITRSSLKELFLGLGLLGILEPHSNRVCDLGLNCGKLWWLCFSRRMEVNTVTTVSAVDHSGSH